MHSRFGHIPLFYRRRWRSLLGVVWLMVVTWHQYNCYPRRRQAKTFSSCYVTRSTNDWWCDSSGLWWYQDWLKLKLCIIYLHSQSNSCDTDILQIGVIFELALDFYFSYFIFNGKLLQIFLTSVIQPFGKKES